MADRSILYRLRAALQGGYVAVAQEVELLASYVGLLNGVNDTETALRRLDGTGIGSSIFRFTSNYQAQNSNINEWFGGRQLTRLRCTSHGGTLPPTFTLPGATALGTAFDQLVAAGLPEVITFVIEYTGETTTRLRIIPRSGTGNPVIQGTSVILVASGIAATVEITRNSGVLSDFVFTSIGGIGDTSGSVFDSIKLINPANAVWDASTNGSLPTQVVKGNAYRVANAPSDGSGRFGEIMQNNDWVVWEAETFTSWSATPHQWFVIPAHEVRRISALETEFLNSVVVTPESDRNTVLRGANYADTSNEIRLKIYTNRGDYNAADLNTTGDIDEYTDASDQTGYLAIRLGGTQSSLLSVLPTLYVYSEDANGNFTRLLNLSDDFTHQGDFGQESDYLTTDTINYNNGDTWRIYVGSIEDRYNSPDLDVFESNLSSSVQSKLNRTSGDHTVDSERLSTLESKMDALYPLTPDVSDLVTFADSFGAETTTQVVDITNGYSLIADFRDSSTRYESSGVTYDESGTNVIRYTGLGDNLYRTFGFKVTSPSDQVLLWLVDGTTLIPYIDMTASGNYRINSYRNEVADDEVIRDQIHFLTKTSGSATLAAGDGNVQTFTIPNFPTNATSTSRTQQVDLDVYVNGVDTQASHLAEFNLPATNTAQSKQTVDATIYLGPLHNNRNVSVTFGYTLRIDGSNLVVDFDIVSAPSDVTIDMRDVATLLNYTAAGATTRVDSFQVLQDSGGDYTFTGENELLITFHPYQISNSMNAVPVAVDSTGSIDELNDVRTPIPSHGFSSVEIPDTIDFRTFSPEHFLNHSDLAHLLTRRNVQWCYGLALLRPVSEQSITEVIDFTEGIILTGNTNNTRVRLVIDDADTSNIKITLVEQ